MRVGGIKQLLSFEHRREWRDVTRDKLAVGIGFHMRTLPSPVCVAHHQCFPRSAVKRSAQQALLCNSTLAHTENYYGLSDRHGWEDGAVDCCLPSIGHNY